MLLKILHFVLMLVLLVPIGCADNQEEDIAPPEVTFSGTHLDTGNPVHTLAGTIEVGARLEISVNEELLPDEQISISGENWTATLTLSPGNNLIIIKALDNLDNNQSLFVNLVFDALSLESYRTPVSDGNSGLLLQGYFDADSGEIPMLEWVDTGEMFPVTTNGDLWSSEPSGLDDGTNDLVLSLQRPGEDLLEVEFSIKVDEDAPFVGINQSLAGTDLPSLVISGTLSEQVDSLTLSPTPLEGKPLIDTNALTWTATLTRLQPGKNQLVLTAKSSGPSVVLRDMIRLSPGNVRINQVSPASGAFDVDPAGDIWVEFGVDVDPLSLTDQTFTLLAGEDVIAATLVYDEQTRIASLTPLAELALGTTYHVILAGSIAPLDGETLGKELSWDFTTASE